MPVLPSFTGGRSLENFSVYFAEVGPKVHSTIPNTNQFFYPPSQVRLLSFGKTNEAKVAEIIN